MANVYTLTEADLFRSYWDDGILDLLCGLALLVTGLGWETELGPLATLQAPLWITLWVPLRRKLVEPRSGYVRFCLARQKATTRRLSWSLALGVGVLAFVAALSYPLRAGATGLAVGHLTAGLPAVLVALAAAIGGILTGARRFYGYALGLVAAAVATVLLGLGPALPLALGGLAGMTSGTVLLTRFVRGSRGYAEQA